MSAPPGGRPADITADDLRAALDGGQFVLHFQPKVDVANGHIAGVEALVRWRHPDRDLIPPDRFIPVAERSGVMIDIDAFVADAAVRQHAEWRDRGLYLPVAVNVSAVTLADDLPATVEGACSRYGVDPSVVELEVTETAVMADPSNAVRVLRELDGAGFRIAIDDFGTGLSSLAYVRDLPASTVKIDRSFVAGLPDSAHDGHIVRGTIDLVHALGRKVVAEGVESAEAVQLLLLLGCDEGQGYYWSAPLDARDLEVWVRRRECAGSHVPPPRPACEDDRLAALRRYNILDTAYEAIFDDIASAAARICGTPMSAITLVDADRQWFKAAIGLGVRQTTRELAFCAHTILDPDRVLLVEDATADPRFATNDFVTGEPNIRFYAGAPIVTPDGQAIGSMCVVDTAPRQLTEAQVEALRRLSQQVIVLLEARREIESIAGVR